MGCCIVACGRADDNAGHAVCLPSSYPATGLPCSYGSCSWLGCALRSGPVAGAKWNSPAMCDRSWPTLLQVPWSRSGASRGRFAARRAERAVAAGESGERAIVPGEPEASELLRRVSSAGSRGSNAAAGHEESRSRPRTRDPAEMDRCRGRLPVTLGVSAAAKTGCQQ